MIQAVSSSSIVNLSNKCNYSGVSFKGGLHSNVILRKEGRYIADRFTRSAVDILSSEAAKIANKKELPVRKNPIIAALDPLRKLAKDHTCDVVYQLVDTAENSAPTVELTLLAEGIKLLLKAIKHYDD